MMTMRVLIALLLIGATVASAQDDMSAPVFELENIAVIAPNAVFESAAVAVTNTSDHHADGLIWYYLSPVGSAEPWNTVRYASGEQSIALAAGETAYLTFDAPGIGVIGTFDLSFWVHHVDGETGERFHSDGQGYDAPVIVEPPGAFVLDPVRDTADDTRIVRGDARTYETQRLKITAMNIEQIDGRIASVQVALLNVGAAPVDGFVWYILAPPDAEQPWTQIQYMTPEQRIVQLPPGERASYTFYSVDPIPDGRYALWVYTHAILNAGTNARGDGDGVGENIVIGEAIHGVIERAERTMRDDGTSAVQVTARAENATDAPIIAGMFYSIAAPDVPTPWRSAAFNAPIRFVQVGAGESAALAWDDAVQLPAGMYTVTIWMFQVEDGRLVLRDTDAAEITL